MSRFRPPSGVCPSSLWGVPVTTGLSRRQPVHCQRQALPRGAVHTGVPSSLARSGSGPNVTWGSRFITKRKSASISPRETHFRPCLTRSPGAWAAASPEVSRVASEPGFPAELSPFLLSPGFVCFHPRCSCAGQNPRGTGPLGREAPCPAHPVPPLHGSLCHLPPVPE